MPARNLISIFTAACLSITFCAMKPAFTQPHTNSTAASSERVQPVLQVQEYYELRIYNINDFSKMQQVLDHLENAYIPALGRLGIDRIGVFTNLQDVNDHSVYVLIPYKDLKTFSGLNDALATDEAYQTASKNYFNRPLKDPLFERIESRLMKAFAGIPSLEIPEYSQTKQERIFELRLYESHTEAHAARKVQMFNEGEIQIMRDCEMGPLFFGETLIGPDVPNLIYMLSATNQKLHKEHWQTFLKHPEWLRIKDLEQYKDTVSKIRKWFLKPTEFSQL